MIDLAKALSVDFNLRVSQFTNRDWKPAPLVLFQQRASLAALCTHRATVCTIVIVRTAVQGMLASHKVDIDGMRCTVQVFKNGMHKLLVGSEKRVFKYCGPDSGLEGKVRALLGSSSKQVSEQTAPALQSAAAAHVCACLAARVLTEL